MTETNQKNAGPESDQPAAAPEVAAPSAAAPESAPAGGVSETKVASLEAEISTLKDQLLRALAEVENVRRRAQREREDTAKFAVAGFSKELVVVADNLRRALDAVPADTRAGSEPVNNLMVGIEATERQLFAAFERAGIRKMSPQGEHFDPNFHQVMFEVENTGKPAGTVIQVLQDGYTLNGRLLREAMVGVAKGGAGETAGEHIDTKA
jgi:molecular chaperone GrpE